MSLVGLALWLATLLAIVGGFVAIRQRDAARHRADDLAVLLDFARERRDIAVELMRLAEQKYSHMGVRAWQRRQRRKGSRRLVWVPMVGRGASDGRKA